MPGKKRHATESEEEVQPIWLARADQWAWVSSMRILISSELPVRSGAYMAVARVGRALNQPGISARIVAIPCFFISVDLRLPQARIDGRLPPFCGGFLVRYVLRGGSMFGPLELENGDNPDPATWLDAIWVQ